MRSIFSLMLTYWVALAWVFILPFHTWGLVPVAPIAHLVRIWFHTAAITDALLEMLPAVYSIRIVPPPT